MFFNNNNIIDQPSSDNSSSISISGGSSSSSSSSSGSGSNDPIVPSPWWDQDSHMSRKMNIATVPDLIAFVAPIINTTEFMPQLYKTYMMKEVKDLSVLSIILHLFTNFLWILHGYYIDDFPLRVSSFISFTINLFMVVLYMKYSGTRSLT